MRNMARAEALQKVGYMPYMGPDVAGLTSPQQQAMQANIDAASAFGLVDPGMSATDGMPQTSQFGGISGYSSYPMYQEAVDNYEATSPGQARQYNNLFVNPQSGLGGTTGTGMMGGGINSGGQNNSGAGSHTGDPGDVGQFTAFDPTQYSISDANPYGVSFTAQAPDMTGYITADQLDERLMAMQPAAPQDMSGYTTTEQLNNALSGLPTYQPQDLSGYARTTDLYDDSQLRQDINSRFSNVNAFDPSNLQAQITANQQGLANLPAAQAPDLSGYATTSALSDAISGINTYDDSQLRQDINSRFSNIPQFDASGLQSQITANQQGLANLPTVSAPDLSGYATTNDLTSAISGLDIPAYTAPDLSGYATTNDLTSAISGIPSYQAPDLSGYATTEQLNNRFEAFDPMSSMPDLSNYAQMSDLYDDSQLRSDINSRFETFNPDVTMPDLSNYATTESVNNRFSNLSQYDDSALREDINNRFSNLPTYQAPDLSGYATSEQLNTAIAGVPQFDPSSIDLSGYATSQDLNSAISGLPTYQAPDLSNYAQMSDLYNDNQLRQDINSRFSNLPTYQAPDLSGYATTQSVNNQFNNLSQFDPSGLQNQINANQQAISNLPSYQAPDLGNYATKDQLIGLLSDIGTSSTGVNPSLYSDPNLGQNNATVTPIKATTKKKVSTKKGAR